MEIYKSLDEENSQVDHLFGLLLSFPNDTIVKIIKEHLIRPTGEEPGLTDCRQNVFLENFVLNADIVLRKIKSINLAKNR